MPTKTPSDSQEEMAARYGWALSILRSNPELSKLFDNAVKDTYSQARFVAELRNTNWYKRHGEAWRQNEVLKNADPAEFQRRLQMMRANISDVYMQMYGQAPSARNLALFASTAMAYGYSDAEIKDLVGRAGVTERQMRKGLGGTLGEAERQIRNALEDYGLDFGEGWISRQLNYIATGRSDTTAIVNYLKQGALAKYGQYKDQLQQGMTMRDIAEPFRQLMAKTLELSDKSISVADPTIQKALQYRAPAKGGKPGAPAQMPLWQFEEQLKSDPRWMGTQNAQDSLMAAGRKVLQDWGLATGSNS